MKKALMLCLAVLSLAACNQNAPKTGADTTEVVDTVDTAAADTAAVNDIITIN